MTRRALARVGAPREPQPAIDGVVTRDLVARLDVRGSFLEAFRQSWGLSIQPAQWSLVRSAPRALRGLYCHRRHHELFLLAEGRAFVALLDLRRASSTYRRGMQLEVTGDSPRLIVFPPGVLHGWYFHGRSLHLQAVSEEYDSYRQDDNLSCHWADPEARIPWPAAAPVVSAEAQGFGSFGELLRRLGGDGSPEPR